MENRNLILAFVLSAILLFGFQTVMGRLYPQPDEPVVAEQPAAADIPATQAAAPASSAQASSDAAPVPNRTPRSGETGLTNPDQIAEEKELLSVDLSAPERVSITAPELTGSINPLAARIDDLTLNSQRQTVDKDSDPVRILSPAGTLEQDFAQFGWVGEGITLPDAQTRWQAEGGPLSPDSPVTLSWDNGQGQVFTIGLTIDDHYMITAEQSVANNSEASIVVQPYAYINRTSATASTDIWNLHSGPIGAFDGSVDFGNNYDDIEEEKTITPEGHPDWVGFTDRYWMTVLIPQQGSDSETAFRSAGDKLFRADLIYDPISVAAGSTASQTTMLFAGAKDSAVLADYEEAGVTNLSLAIDWGWFRWFEKPILWLLKELYALAGNFGVAIILLTVIVRLILFPVAQKQFASMAAMRALQPKMKAIQERYKDDKQTQQQKIMALYKEEKVNPLAGCLPIFLQIPIFFALYKVLLLSIEMRHKPFVLWIQDLSAPDPLHILNLFGLLPFDVPSMLAIGPLALLLGLTMFLQFRLNPAAMDPMQQQMFMIMPWVLMFVMAPFAAGLLLYWTTSNLLTIGQQAYLYSRHPQLKVQAAKDKADKAKQAEKAKE